jgi:hypothetical protein
LDLTEITSWNPRFSDRQLTLMVIAGYALFFTLSFLRHPARLWALLADMFRPKSEGKLGKYVRSMLNTSRQLNSAPDKVGAGRLRQSRR